MDTLIFFGIYKNALEKADKFCQDVLNNAGLKDKIDSVFDEAYNRFYEFNWNKNVSITNALIYCMFDTTRNCITEKYPDLEIDVYVNCDDSHMIINGENADDFDFEHDKCHIDNEKQ